LEIISKIAPRLLDPKEKTEHLLGLFRFVEDKGRVEECLKARIQTLNNNMFKRDILTGVRGSRSGRGGGGRVVASRLSTYGEKSSADEFDSNSPTDKAIAKHRHTSLPSKLSSIFRLGGLLDGKTAESSSTDDSAFDTTNTLP